MVTYDEVKNAILSLRHDILKYQLVDVLDRRYNVIENTRNTIANIISNLNNSISSAIKQLSFGLALERYITSSTNPIGLKALEFTYNDSTTDMTGLDGNTYDNPTFPQIQLTSSELDELKNAMKDLPSNLRKGLCVIRIKAEDVSKMPRDPDEEDTLFAYYFAEAVNPIEHHAVDYGSQIFGQDITLLAYMYETVDPLIGALVECKLDKVEAESIILGWFYDSGFGDYKIKIGVDIKPTLTLSDPSNPDNKRKTTAMFVLNVYNAINVNGNILIDKFEVPLKAGKHYLVIVGAELHGLRGIEIPIEVPYP